MDLLIVIRQCHWCSLELGYDLIRRDTECVLSSRSLGKKQLPLRIISIGVLRGSENLWDRV